MKKIVFLICLFLAGHSYAQDKQKITGKWKIAAMYDEDRYYDFKKDSLFINEKSAGDRAKEHGTAELQKYKGMLKEMFGSAYIQFNTDMTCIESSPDKGEKKGTYEVDENNKIITVKTEKKSSVTGETMIRESKNRYGFNGERLILLPEAGENGPSIEFEKQ